MKIKMLASAPAILSELNMALVGDLSKIDFG